MIESFIDKTIREKGAFSIIKSYTVSIETNLDHRKDNEDRYLIYDNIDEDFSDEKLSLFCILDGHNTADAASFVAHEL